MTAKRKGTRKCTTKTILSLMLLFGCVVGATGCANKALTVYPIRDTDIRVTGDDETGEVIMSKWYFKNVLKVKLEEGR